MIRGLGVPAGNLGQLVDSVDPFLDLGCQPFGSGCVAANEASDIPVSITVLEIKVFQGATGLVRLCLLADNNACPGPPVGMP